MHTDSDPTPPRGTRRNGITARQWYRVTVCADCMHAAANGEHSTEEHRTAYTAATVRNRAELTPACPYPDCCDPDGDRYWFSWQPCEWCGDTLGGDRMHAAIETR